MDFRGQALCEQVSLFGLVFVAMVSFAVGWTTYDFSQMAKTYAAGVGARCRTMIPREMSVCLSPYVRCSGT